MPRYAETLGIRRASQSNDRQVLPTPMMAHIKANVSATVADDRCMRRCAWPHEYFDPTGSRNNDQKPSSNRSSAERLALVAESD